MKKISNRQNIAAMKKILPTAPGAQPDVSGVYDEFEDEGPVIEEIALGLKASQDAFAAFETIRARI